MKLEIVRLYFLSGWNLDLFVAKYCFIGHVNLFWDVTYLLLLVDCKVPICAVIALLS